MSTSSILPILQDNPQAIEQVAPMPDISELLPMPHLDLTESEKETIQKQSLGRILLGPVAAAVMTCPSLEEPAEPNTNAFLLQQMKRCPHQKSCILLAQGKAPHGHACPMETHYITERFIRWTKEFEKTPYDLCETDRIAISELVSIDLSEQRCLEILGEAENARLLDLSVKETTQQGDPCAWEKVINVNQQALEQLRAQRTRLLKAYELTPEMKTKKARYEGGGLGADLSSVQGARAKKFKQTLVVDQTPQQ